MSALVAEGPAKENRRYSIAVVLRARALFEASWNVAEITRLIEGEFGVKPSETTVKCWVDEEYAERYRRRHVRTSVLRKLEEAPPKPIKLSPERALRRMAELREAGCSYKAIAIVAALWWGEVVDAETVRYRLQNDTLGRSLPGSRSAR